MKISLASAIAAPLLALVTSAAAAATPVSHFGGATMPTPGAAQPPFSRSVLAGDTLYISGTTDNDPATGKPPPDVAAGAKLVLDNVKRAVEQAGMTMDDLVWVQIFATDLGNYATFNQVYRGYFTGPMPARAFIGAGSLLGGAHFEVMGIAVKAKPAK